MFSFSYETISIDGVSSERKGVFKNKKQLEDSLPIDEVLVNFERTKIKKRSVSKTRLMSFTGQLMSLLSSGQTEEEALLILTEDEDIFVSSFSLDILAGIRAGKTIESSMKNSSSWKLPEYYLSAISGGEESNNLPNTLSFLYRFIGDREKGKSKVITAITYPIFVLVVAIVASSYLLIEIVPQMAKNYSTLGRELPDVTLMIMSISNFIRDWGLYILISIITAFFMVVGLLSVSRESKLMAFSFISKIPIIGSILVIGDRYRILTTAGLLLRQGIPVDVSIGIAIRGIYLENNMSIAKEAVERIRMGIPVADSLLTAKILDKKTVGILRSGEFSNKIGDRMIDISEILREKQNQKISIITNIIGPLSILMVGMLILFIALGMLMPMFELNDINF